MIDKPQQQQRIIEHLPLLKSVDAQFRACFFRIAAVVHMRQDHLIAMERDECALLALLVFGKVRVYKLAATGREITLYHIGESDSCVLTAHVS